MKTFGKDVEQIATREGPQRRVQITIDGKTLSAVVPEKKETIAQLPSFPRPTLVTNDLPRISWNDADGGALQAWMYFKAVYEKHRTEAFLWWHWDLEEHRYVMLVPAFYYVSAAGLEYPSPPTHFCRTCCVSLYQGGVRCPHCENGNVRRAIIVGTSHSHGSLQPFHSGEDHANELDQTGFHITFGHLDRPLPIAASFVVSDAKTRFTTDWDQHFAVADRERWEQKLRLWLTLVSPGRSLIGSSRYRVVAAGQVAFMHGDKSACETWLKSQADPSAFAIEESKEPIVSRGDATFDRLFLSSDRNIDTRKENTRGTAYSRSLYGDDDDVPRFAERRRAKKKKQTPVVQRKDADAEVPEFWLYRLLCDVPTPLLGCAYAEVVSQLQRLTSGAFQSPTDDKGIAQLLSEIPDPSEKTTWLDVVSAGISAAEAVETEQDEESWGAYNRMLTTVAVHAADHDLPDFADWVRTMVIPEDEREEKERSDIF